MTKFPFLHALTNSLLGKIPLLYLSVPIGFLWWLSGKESTWDMGSIPGSGRSPGGGLGNPLQYSCLENPMDRGAWWATVHRVAKSQTWLEQLSMHASILLHKLCNNAFIQSPMEKYFRLKIEFIWNGKDVCQRSSNVSYFFAVFLVTLTTGDTFKCHAISPNTMLE